MVPDRRHRPCWSKGTIIYAQLYEAARRERGDMPVAG